MTMLFGIEIFACFWFSETVPRYVPWAGLEFMVLSQFPEG